MMQPGDFTWIFGIGMVFAFLDAYGIGANDVSNAFATSISSGSLTLIQASIIACFTEFLGALLLGSGTSETIKGGILSVSNFVGQPEMLMLAMLCAVFGSAVWVVFASTRGWPVSTTHSIVGAICGVGIAAFGGNSLKWEWGGISSIITSWFLSPIAAGLVAALLYTITKYTVLRRADSFNWGLRLVPAYFFFTVAINAFYIIYKGAPGTDAAKLSVGVIVGISFGVGAVFALFSWFFFVPWVRRRVKGHEDLKWYHVFIIPFLSKRQTLQQADPEMHAPTATTPTASTVTETVDEKIQKDQEELETMETQNEQPQVPKSKFAQYKEKAINAAMHGLRQDVRNLESERLKEVHAAAILYDDDAEYLFSFLQVLTACMASFAHGSNDVANAVGPLASIFDLWNTATVDVTGKVPVPIWILAYGGIAIDIGLLTLGYRVMRKMGNNITYFTPSRGFCAELAAALTVLTCSKLGLPVSTTHCITGATAGVGLCNGNWRAINWKMIGWCFFSWILTLPCAGLLAGLLFAFGSNAPKFISS
ncbi:solute carrier family 20 [Halteromyces radiatus]|uniref:solute carrier family 20 n=1 Tax=Halteromyces radiatus TaxID=101107 RepID=UPI002220E9F4|nr:solute carrier family 20 [Halteromyces radiatus]KAI8099420.1 solute carrier family 20 [Halteromyces radiatus]